jgi:hypothetical protein
MFNLLFHILCYAGALSSVPELNARLLSEQLRSRQRDVVHGETNHPFDTLTHSSHSVTPGSYRDSSHERQGRSRSRFSLASMSSAMLDVMRPRHVVDEAIPSRGRLPEKGNVRVVDQGSRSRGRPLEKPARDHERSTFAILSDALRADHHGENKTEGVNWKEFKKGWWPKFRLPPNTHDVIQAHIHTQYPYPYLTSVRLPFVATLEM